MAKGSVLVFLALFVFAAQCHVLKNREPESKKPDHSREKRSCYECDFGNGHHFPPSPDFSRLPPPPYFHSHNWSGFSRHANRPQHAVFSGASAAANSQATGTAYSAASSSAGAGSGGQAVGYGGQSQHGGHFAANTQHQSSGGQNSIRYNPSGTNDAYTNNHRNIGHQDFEGQQIQKNDFGAGNGGSSNSQSSSGSSAQSISGSAQSISGSGFGNEQQQVQSVDSGFGNWHGHSHDPEKYRDGQQVQSSGSGQWEQASHFGNSYSSPSSGALKLNGGQVEANSVGSTQEAFKGTLDLASQGLQTSQQNGCSTCGKGSYALSNAKSDSGNAIALSIGK